MANKIFNLQDTKIAATIVELNNQNAQHALLQQELDMIKYKLAEASKTLALKDQIIGSLEQDLEHMIDQLTKINRGKEQWLDRPVSGINIEATVIA